MNRRRAIVAIALATLLVAAAALAYTRFFLESPVRVDLVQSGRVPRQVSGPGTVQARVPVTLSARLTATLTSVAVDVGDKVRAGQVLATLDDRDLVARRAAVGGQQASLAQQVVAAQASVERARADLDLARLKAKREADLLRQGFVSQSAFDATNAALKSAQAGLDSALATLAARRADEKTLVQEAHLAEAQASYSRLVAPMDAVVTQRLAEPGTTVSPGTPILRLVDPATLWVAVRVDESVVGRVATGQGARIRLRTGETVEGRVARIAAQSDAATRELDVFVAFTTPPARFAIDQEAQVRIDVGFDEGLVVPVDALTRDAEGRPGVLRVVEGRTRFAPVTTGTAGESTVVIRQGLSAGDAVASPAQGLKSGQRVAPLPSAPTKAAPPPSR